MQGRVPEPIDEPLTCNTELVGQFGTSGGFKVERYVDADGHECAYFDSTTVFPIDVPNSVGTYVLDMADPSQPRQTAELVTPAMLTPHESLLANTRRGLLAAVMGNPAVYPGIVDVYDLTADCREPVLRSSSPAGILGHESGFAPDGNTFYAASLATGNTTAVDVSNPDLPVTLWIGNYASHGLSLNADGTRAYLAARTGAGPDGDRPGLIILDVSEIQDRVPNSAGARRQHADVGRREHPAERDAVQRRRPPVPARDRRVRGRAGAEQRPRRARRRRAASSTSPTRPTRRVVSNIRLEVHLPQNRAEVVGDAGSVGPISGYSGHYCGIPRETDPGIAACSMIASGLRVFDISDPLHPREIAYFNVPNAFAMSRPSFVPERSEIWYADGFNGFHVVRVTNGAWAGAPPHRRPVRADRAVRAVRAPGPSSTATTTAAAVAPSATPRGPLAQDRRVAADRARPACCSPARSCCAAVPGPMLAERAHDPTAPYRWLGDDDAPMLDRDRRPRRRGGHRAGRGVDRRPPGRRRVRVDTAAARRRARERRRRHRTRRRRRARVAARRAVRRRQRLRDPSSSDGGDPVEILDPPARLTLTVPHEATGVVFSADGTSWDPLPVESLDPEHVEADVAARGYYLAVAEHDLSGSRADGQSTVGVALAVAVRRSSVLVALFAGPKPAGQTPFMRSPLRGQPRLGSLSAPQRVERGQWHRWAKTRGASRSEPGCSSATGSSRSSGRGSRSPRTPARGTW